MSAWPTAVALSSRSGSQLRKTLPGIRSCPARLVLSPSPVCQQGTRHRYAVLVSASTSRSRAESPNGFPGASGTPDAPAGTLPSELGRDLDKQMVCLCGGR